MDEAFLPTQRSAGQGGPAIANSFVDEDRGH